MKIAKDGLIPNYIVPLLILLGVTLILFFQAAEISTAHDHNQYAFYSFTNGLEDYYGFKTAWRPRILSNALAALAVRVSNSILYRTTVLSIKDPLELTVALWTASWFLLTCLAFIYFVRRHSVFYILGTYAALSFGYMPRMATRIYPWDMPALFIYTLFVILFFQNRYRWILALLPIGMGFKETTGLLCLAFLFSDLPRKEKWLLFASAAAICISVKVALDLFVKVPLPLFTMEAGSTETLRSLYFTGNLINLTKLHPFLINAGTLLAFLILPILNKKILALKIIAILFILGNFAFGVIYEYRIWFELIPFALSAIEIACFGGSSLSAEEPASPRSADEPPVA